MRIAFIATYPPEKCGIGTFTHNLRNAIEMVTEGNDTYTTSIVAVSSSPSEFKYPKEVKFKVNKNKPKHYVEAAKYLNENADICFLQHEFGIFGGENGNYILMLLSKLKIPLVVTFHTVLNKPSKGQISVMSAISRRASRVFVMSDLAVDFLEHIYKVDREKIVKIEHGVPVFHMPSRDLLRRKLGFEGKRVLFTFGLLSRNKGLEVVINALPKVVKKYPDVQYVILGKTHPNVVKESGEEYRNYLKLLAQKRGVEKHVVFDDRYVTDEELIQMLKACDVYITPYMNEEQITSGTLSYAIGVGALVVSTPYWHAKELLDEQRGVLFPFNNSDSLAERLIELFDDPEKADRIREAASLYGMQLSWPKIAQRYLTSLDNVMKESPPEILLEGNHIDISVMPEFNFKHLRKLTDDTGILQHTKYDVPNLKEGYCIDDNSRALIMVLMARKFIKEADLSHYVTKYLSFIHYLQKDDGSFHNMLKYNYGYIPEKDSEDAFGRTIWALGTLVWEAQSDGHRQLAIEMTEKALPVVDTLKSLRGKGNTLIGLCRYAGNDDKRMKAVKDKIVKLADDLVDAFKNNDSGSWRWFEDILTYDNGILPLALLNAFNVTGERRYIDVAVKSMNFLEKQTLINGIFIPVGNKEWYKKGGKRYDYDQQPVEVMSMVLAYLQLFRITGDDSYLGSLFRTYLWFLGNNTNHVSLYDHKTGACYDALTPKGVNENQGAESLIAYWISHFTVLEAYYLQYS
ncbi:MAG: glycosyltransferase [Chlorobi bacterium]|nr:glycosyltransferase [Chlorobiota bacterium]